jgi:subtilisin family serine protease
VPFYNYEDRFIQKEVSKDDSLAADAFDWIMMLTDGQSAQQREEFCGGVDGCRVFGQKGGVEFATLRSTEGELESFLKHRSAQVKFVEPDFPVEPIPEMPEPEVSVSSVPWSHEKVNLAQARHTGRGVHIYVMDTGVRVTHEDFGGRAIPTIDTIAGGGNAKECARGDTSCAGDTNGHGTHCAATAGGAKYGVAKRATIHAMKVCCGSGTNIIGGMDWTVRKAAQPAIMTMSLGSYSMPESSRVAVDAVVNSGVTVIVSAGNRAVDSCTKSYTFIASALGVGSSDPSDSRSSFSNFGSCNAIYAPGRSILSASHTSNTGSTTMSGTSMAAPLVAGAAAMLLEGSPSLSPSQIRSTLRSRATRGVLTNLMAGDPNLLLNLA